MGNLKWPIVSFAQNDIYMSFVPIFVHFMFCLFFCMALARISSIILNTQGDRVCPFLAFDIGGMFSIFHPSV